MLLLSMTFYISSAPTSKPCNEFKMNGKPGEGWASLRLFLPITFYMNSAPMRAMGLILRLHSVIRQVLTITETVSVFVKNIPYKRLRTLAKFYILYLFMNFRFF